MPAGRNIVTLTHQKAAKAPSVLRLDFGKEAQLAKNWYDALRFTITSWSELLAETHGVLGLYVATDPGEELSDEALSAARKEEKS